MASSIYCIWLNFFASCSGPGARSVLKEVNPMMIRTALAVCALAFTVFGTEHMAGTWKLNYKALKDEVETTRFTCEDALAPLSDTEKCTAASGLRSRS
jgi:hypothetical protein